MSTFCTIQVIRGAGTSGTVTLTQNSTAVDITGYTGTLVAKESKSDADADAVINNALTISDASNGIFAYSISDEDTDALDIKTYVAEITIVPVTGSSIKVQGYIQVTEEVLDG